MKNEKELKKFLKNGHLEYRTGVTVDCAIFGYHEGELKLLLVKNKIVTKWCLPGGYIKKQETIEEAAARVTSERTGIGNLFLQQFKTFGDPGRNQLDAIDKKKFLKATGIDTENTGWLNTNTVSVGFYAISDIVNAKPQADFFSSECQWFSINELPSLGFDHEIIAKQALSAMRMHLYHFPVGQSLLPQRFTLKEIKLFYEVMSGKELHASNFPGKLISLGLIVKTTDKRSIGAHRSPAYYRFDEAVYERALKEGLVLV